MTRLCQCRKTKTADSSADADVPSCKVLLLGLGNDVLSDDAVGLVIARALTAEFADDETVDVRETAEMGLALLDFIVGYSSAIIVDSIQTSNAPPGTVHAFDADKLECLQGRTPHFLGVGETLALGRRLGLPMPTRVRVLAVEVDDPFTLGAELTAPLRSALPRIVDVVRSELNKMRRDRDSPRSAESG